MNQKPVSVMATKKWVPRPMPDTCGVCGAPAADVCHYGSTACYSCRAFFRRSIGIGKEFVKCARGTGSCVIDQVNRTNCKKCRFDKCLQNGMKPEKVGKSMTNAKRILKATQEAKTPEFICSTSSWTEKKESLNDARDEGKTVKSENIQHFVDISDLAESIVSEELHQCEHSNSNERDNIETESVPTESICSTQPSIICEINSSNNGHIVDISDPAENCILVVLDQFEIPNHIEVQDMETESNANYFFPLTNLLNPVLRLTLEEEFKIHELDAIKENFLDGCFKTLHREFPDFQKIISSHLISLSQGLFPTKAAVLQIQNIKNQILINNAGEIFKLLDFYSIFEDVPEEVKLETFKFSLVVVSLCFKAFFKVNSDKESLIEQKRAAGLLGPALEQLLHQIQNKNSVSLNSVDHYAPTMFDSPWASRPSDEDKFNHTMQAVGELVKDDVKLGTLYVTLILATPGEELSQVTKDNPALVTVQEEISLLIYRYLKNKYRDAERATQTLNSLLKLIVDLHTCRAIHLFGRIQHTGQDQVAMCSTPENLQTIAGKWKFESGQGFLDFLKDRGIGIAVRAVIKRTTSTLTFAKEAGDTWSQTRNTFIAGKLFKTNKKLWIDGEEFYTQSSDGKEVKMTFKFQNGVLVTREKVLGGVESMITQRLEGDKMIMEGIVLGKENKFKLIFARD